MSETSADDCITKARGVFDEVIMLGFDNMGHLTILGNVDQPRSCVLLSASLEFLRDQMVDEEETIH